MTQKKAKGYFLIRLRYTSPQRHINAHTTHEPGASAEEAVKKTCDTKALVLADLVLIRHRTCKTRVARRIIRVTGDFQSPRNPY